MPSFSKMIAERSCREEYAAGTTLQERSPGYFAGRHGLCEEGAVNGQGPEQQTSPKGRALRALVALPLGWGAQTSDLWLHLPHRAGLLAESPLVLPTVGMETAPDFGLGNLGSTSRLCPL